MIGGPITKLWHSYRSASWIQERAGAERGPSDISIEKRGLRILRKKTKRYKHIYIYMCVCVYNWMNWLDIQWLLPTANDCFVCLKLLFVFTLFLAFLPSRYFGIFLLFFLDRILDLLFFFFGILKPFEIFYKNITKKKKKERKKSKQTNKKNWKKKLWKKKERKTKHW